MTGETGDGSRVTGDVGEAAWKEAINATVVAMTDTWKRAGRTRIWRRFGWKLIATNGEPGTESILTRLESGRGPWRRVWLTKWRFKLMRWKRPARVTPVVMVWGLGTEGTQETEGTKGD